MGFAPMASGQMRTVLPPLRLHACVPPLVWRMAYRWAQQWLENLRADARLSTAFAPCIATLECHLQEAQQQLERLA